LWERISAVQTWIQGFVHCWDATRQLLIINN
jgi:hypothetical protein